MNHLELKATLAHIGPLLVGFIVLIYVLASFNVKIERFAFIQAQNFSDDWKVAESTTTYTAMKQLPSYIPRNTVVSFTLTDAEYQIFIDNKEIKRMENNSAKAVVGGFSLYYTFAGIPTDAAGKTLRIQLKSANKNSVVPPASIFIGTHNSVLLALISEYRITIGVCLLLFFMGIYAFLVELTNRVHKTRAPWSNANLAFFMILCSAYFFYSSYLPQLFTNNNALIYYISYSIFMFFAIPLLLFIASVFPKHKNQLTYFALAFALVFIIRTIGIGLELWKITDLLIIFHVMMFFAAIYMLYVFFKERSEVSRFIFYAIVTITLVTIAFVLLFHLKEELHLTLINYYDFLAIGLFIFSLFLLMGTVQNSFVLRGKALRASLYEQLAYMDVMTNMRNRADCDRELLRINKLRNTLQDITFIMCDLNNLKKTNDTYGHESGDHLIKGMAQCLDLAFSEIGKIYRNGGDEFVVIMLNQQEEKINAACTKLAKLAKSYRTEQNEPLFYAIGICRFSSADGDIPEVREILKAADRRMYLDKQKSKKK